MSIMTRLLAPPTRQPNKTERRSLLDLLGSGAPGQVPVTEMSAMQLSAVVACVRVLSETVAQLPLILYERLERGKRRAADHPLYRVLHDQANPLMTSFEFRETLQGHLCLYGNGYAEIEYDERGQVKALWPLRPDRMVEIKQTSDGLTYIYQLEQGKQIVLPGYRVFHLRGLGFDGIRGYSVIRDYARKVIGLGLTVQEFGNLFFENGAQPGGVLQHPGVLGDTGYRNVMESWNEAHGGLGNSHRIAILEEGMQYERIGVPPNEAQFLETRKFNRAEIAAIFRVPPHMIGDLERATFSNIEQQSIEFKVFTMEPWLQRWQQAIHGRLLMAGPEQDRYFAEFLADALLRGDTASRYQAHAVGRQNGWLSANDIRELENMNPIKGGDVYLVPLNMAPALEDPAGMGDERGDTRYEIRDTEEATSDERRVTKEGEFRAKQRSAAGKRHQLQVDFVPVFEDVTGRIVRRMANDIAAAAKKWLEKDRRKFEDWLDQFWEEHEVWTRTALGPAMGTYSTQVSALAAAELGKDAPNVAAFVEAYGESSAARLVGRKRAALRKKLRATSDERGVRSDERRATSDELEEGEDEGTVLDEVLGLLDHWKDIEPARMAREETVRMSNAVAIAVYGSLMVSRKTWLSFGDNCPYCDALNGRTVGLETFFLVEGSEFLPAGVTIPLTVSTSIGHAPAHDGCDCMVVAG